MTDIEIYIVEKLDDDEAYELEKKLLAYLTDLGYNTGIEVIHCYRECPVCKEERGVIVGKNSDSP